MPRTCAKFDLDVADASEGNKSKSKYLWYAQSLRSKKDPEEKFLETKKSEKSKEDAAMEDAMGDKEME